MIYPIKILEKKLEEISGAVGKIDNTILQLRENEDEESAKAKKKLFKRAKDLRDAISILEKESTVDEFLSQNPSIKKSKN